MIYASDQAIVFGLPLINNSHPTGSSVASRDDLSARRLCRASRRARRGFVFSRPALVRKRMY
eukprot:8677259-Heterocapsa_arctica.AAC.1